MADILLWTDADIPSLNQTVDVTIREKLPTADPATDAFTQVYRSPHTKSHQGYTTDGTYHYTFNNDHIYKYNEYWSLVAENTSPNADLTAATNHLGDGDYHPGDGYLYVGVVEWDNTTSTANYPTVGVWNATDLSYVTEYSISQGAVAIPGMTVDGTNGEAWLADYNDETQVFRYNLADFSYLSSLPLSTTIPEIQGIYYREADGYLYITNDVDDTTHVVDQNGDTLNTVATYLTNHYEGLDYSQDDLRVLIDDGTGERDVLFWDIVNAEATQTIDDGENTYTLAGFNGVNSGNEYHYHAELQTTDEETTARVNSIEVREP